MVGHLAKSVGLRETFHNKTINIIIRIMFIIVKPGLQTEVNLIILLLLTTALDLCQPLLSDTV